MERRTRRSPRCALAMVGALALAGSGCSGASEGAATEAAPAASAHEGEVPLRIPERTTIPDGPLGDAIERGERLVGHTETELPEHVGNGLRCTSCHLRGGTVAGAGPWVGITAVFPQYRSRGARVDTIETRVNDCFERSLNGTALDPVGADMAAIVAYMTWLSRDVPTGHEVEGRGFRRIEPAPVPDRDHGRALYAERCAVCHGEDGGGRTLPDGGYQFPALWGERSFNIGAGMARLDTAAAYVRWNMPLGQGGSLTDQDAYDVAAFFIEEPRPDFARKAEDWPAGGRPRDARY